MQGRKGAEAKGGKGEVLPCPFSPLLLFVRIRFITATKDSALAPSCFFGMEPGELISCYFAASFEAATCADSSGALTVSLIAGARN